MTELSRATVGIVGLGLIGGSLGLALQGKARRRIGVDPSARARRAAMRRRAVQEASADLRRLGVCDLVIVAAPQERIPAVCAKAARCMREGSVLLEVASVKGPVAAAVLRIPGRVDVVSGHPMAGTERSGIENASAGMFEGRPFALIPLRVRNRRALVLARELVRAVGSREVWMLDPAEHDAAMAVLTGLTHLAAFALAGLKADARLAGPSYLGATRVAASDPAGVAAMLHANRRALRRALPRFVRGLKRVGAALDNPAWLRRLLAESVNRRSAR